MQPRYTAPTPTPQATGEATVTNLTARILWVQSIGKLIKFPPLETIIVAPEDVEQVGYALVGVFAPYVADGTITYTLPEPPPPEADPTGTTECPPATPPTTTTAPAPTPGQLPSDTTTPPTAASKPGLKGSSK
jgi:hypothetical protein